MEDLVNRVTHIKISLLLRNSVPWQHQRIDHLTARSQGPVTNWQHDLRQIFCAAGMPERHPHQLRDTFAVALLEKGVPLEDVSRALGHESIKTTEKY